MKKGKYKKGKKGIVPIVAIVLVIMSGIVVTEGVYLNNFIANFEVIRRSAEETTAIGVIDLIEFSKKALQQAVSYSFYGASSDTLKFGGFCAYDESYCDEDCKIPKAVATLDCKPWWRIYNNVYAPEYDSSQPDQKKNTFIGYLSSRTSALYNDYSGTFSGPQYCPMPPGEVNVEEKGIYKVLVNATNVAGGTIGYSTAISSSDKNDVISIVERNVFFSDTVDATTLDIFKFARDEFVSKDRIKSAFDAADKEMKNRWCKMNGGYCDATVNCQGSEHCCKAIYFGDVCENDAGEGFCDSKLPLYCDIKDNTRSNPCNFNRDNFVDANEQYNCSVQSKLKEDVYNSDKTIKSTVSIDGCILVGQKSTLSGETLYDCNIVKQNGCECAQVCTPDMCGCPEEGSACNPGCCKTYLGNKVSGQWLSNPKCEESNTVSCGSYDADNCPSDCCHLVETGKDSSGNPTYSCSQNSCGSYSYDSCPTSCGCAKDMNWYWQCTPAPEGCGLSSDGCCLKPYGVVKDAKCDYSYFGTTNVSVTVADVKNKYPIDSSWTALSMPFYVVSGNAAECDGTKSTEASSYVVNKDSLCCPALSTNIADTTKGCKTLK